MTDTKDADFVPQESAGSNSNSKKKSKAGRIKLVRESKQLDGISRYGLAKLNTLRQGTAEAELMGY